MSLNRKFFSRSAAVFPGIVIAFSLQMQVSSPTAQGLTPPVTNKASAVGRCAALEGLKLDQVAIESAAAQKAIAPVAGAKAWTHRSPEKIVGRPRLGGAMGLPAAEREKQRLLYASEPRRPLAGRRPQQSLELCLSSLRTGSAGICFVV